MLRASLLVGLLLVVGSFLPTAATAEKLVRPVLRPASCGQPGVSPFEILPFNTPTTWDDPNTGMNIWVPHYPANLFDPGASPNQWVGFHSWDGVCMVLMWVEVCVEDIELDDPPALDCEPPL